MPAADRRLDRGQRQEIVVVVEIARRWARLLALTAIGLNAPTLAQTSRAPLDAVVEVARTAGLAGELQLYDGEEADGRVLGLADQSRRRPHRLGDRWLWASVTKQVTAVLVMQEVERGRLSLDSTIRSVLPDYAGATGDVVTIRMLLQHQSGLRNPEATAVSQDVVPAFYLERGVGITNTARALGYCSTASEPPPTDRFAYNNCDYLVLGAILERVTGSSFGALIQQRIARPLNLRSLRVARDGAAREGATATGYASGEAVAPPVNVATFGASAALTGTARDLLLFDRALLDGRLLSDASREVLWEGNPKLGYEALGVWVFPATLKGCEGPVALVERRGDVGGIQVRNVIAPKLNRALVVFVNDQSVDFGEIWQGKGLSHDLLSAAFCTPAG